MAAAATVVVATVVAATVTLAVAEVATVVATEVAVEATAEAVVDMVAVVTAVVAADTSHKEVATKAKETATAADNNRAPMAAADTEAAQESHLCETKKIQSLWVVCKNTANRCKPGHR